MTESTTTGPPSATWLDRYDRSIPDPPLCPLCARVGYPITGCQTCHKPWYCDRGQHMDEGDGICGDCGAVRQNAHNKARGLS